MRYLLYFVLIIAGISFFLRATSGPKSSPEIEELALPSKPAAPVEDPPRIEVVSSRLAPFTTAAGQSAQMAYVDWKNTGTRPVRAVFASLQAFNGATRLDSLSVDHYCIYSDSTGILPGQTYQEPDGQGHVLIDILSPPATSLRVHITKVEEVSGFE